MSQPNQLCVSIDVSKATLDIAASSDIAQFTVSNDSDGFDAILDGLIKHSVALVLMEATSGLEAAVAARSKRKAFPSSWSIPGRSVILPVPWGIWQRLTELIPKFSHKWLGSSTNIRNGNVLSGGCQMRSVRFSLRW